jgi:hypothetical protein
LKWKPFPIIKIKRKEVFNIWVVDKYTADRVKIGLRSGVPIPVIAERMIIQIDVVIAISKGQYKIKE